MVMSNKQILPRSYSSLVFLGKFAYFILRIHSKFNESLEQDSALLNRVPCCKPMHTKEVNKIHAKRRKR
jgi:hypothetical protein